MKCLFYLPRLTTISLALLLTAGVIVVSSMGCRPKSACGSKRDHRKRAKRVKKFAPTMSMNDQLLLNNMISHQVPDYIAI